MCIPVKNHFQAQQKARADRKAAALQQNDYHRTTKGLLEIALKKANSTNSLTHGDPAKAALERKAGANEAVP